MSGRRTGGLFRPRQPSRNAIEAADHQRGVRLQLVARINESTKAVQHEFHDQEKPITSCELTNDLCRSLEALLIHGLRDSFLDIVSSVISDTKPPEPNFWAPLLVISHSDVIKQIGRLSQIRCDVGRGRAWLRAALNDGLFTSYLTMMLEDRRLLNYHYDKLALLRDKEQMDIVKNYLQGLEALTFALATNSSLLNDVDEAALELAGVWFRPRQLGRGSVSQGQDVAACIAAPVPRPRPPAELALPLPEPQAPTLIMNALDPDMAFDVIMRTTSVDGTRAAPATAAAGGPAVPAAPSTTGGGSGLNSEASSLAGELAAITKPPPKSESYISVLESYRENSPRARSLMQTPDVQFVFGRSVGSSTASATSSGGNSNELEASGESEKQPPATVGKQQPEVADSAPALAEDPVPYSAPEKAKIEAVSADSQDDSPGKQIDPRYRWLTDISPESGLDNQRYTCGNCQRFVGMLYGEPRLCTLDGGLYCGDCHTGRDHAQMPSRIIHNWDFDRYPVARCNREFLEHVDAEPTINVAEQNLSIYNISAEMDRVRLLRVRLVFLNAFLHTCRSGAAAELDRRLAGRRHLCEHVHLFAPVDLRDTRNGSLAPTLQAVVEFGVEHVVNCGLCSQKGFVCEFCKDGRIIYPFELETTRQCRQCYGLYHSRCWRRPAACPRCERYRRRAELCRLLEEPDLRRGEDGGRRKSPTTADRQSPAEGVPPNSARAVSVQ